VQEATGESVELAYVGQAYTGEEAECDAASFGIELQVVGLPAAKRGFVLLPRRWVGERSFAWMARFRRLPRDYERLDETLKGLHYLAFSMLLLHRAASGSPLSPSSRPDPSLSTRPATNPDPMVWVIGPLAHSFYMSRLSGQ
jgi:transposase